MHLDNLRAALAFESLGWSVIPIRTGSKKAAVRWEQYQKTRATPAQIKSWWRSNPEYGVAIITGDVSGLLVIDVDPRYGATNDNMPETDLIVETGRGDGGRHYYYKHIPGLQKYKSPNGYDVQANGAYVIAPPTLHEDTGLAYESLADGDPGDIKIELLLSLFPPVKPKSNAPEPSGDNVIDIRHAQDRNWMKSAAEFGFKEGDRDDGLTRFAGALAKKELSADIAIQLLKSIADKCIPPFPHEDVERICKSIYGREARKPKVEAEAPKEEEGSEAVAKSGGLKLTKFGAYARKHGGQSVDWLIPGFVPSKTILWFVGMPGSFKTWVQFDIAVSLATGTPFLGLEKCIPRKTGPVIIIQQEDSHQDISERISTIYMERRGILAPRIEDGIIYNTLPPDLDDIDIHMYEDRDFRLDNSEKMDDLEKTIQEIRPIAVLMDPFYSLVSMEDHMQEGAQNILRLKSMRDRYGCTFGFVHHTTKGSLGHGGRGRMMGSNFLNASAECTIGMHNKNGSKSRAFLTMETKSAGARPNYEIKFDIVDHSSDKPGPWRYKTESREVSSSEMFRAIDPEKWRDNGFDDEDGEDNGEKRAHAPSVTLVKDGDGPEFSLEELEILEEASAKQGTTVNDIYDLFKKRRDLGSDRMRAEFALNATEGLMKRGALILKDKRFFRSLTPAVT